MDKLLRAHNAARASENSPLAGIGLMLAGCAIFAVNDVLGKWLVATYPIGQMLLIRSAAALAVLAPLWRKGGAVRGITFRPAAQFARVAFATAEVVLFYAAIYRLPLADVIAFYLAAPLFVTALSASFLGERVERRRWLAVLVGFAGVLVALRPTSASFTWPALIPLAGTVAFSCSMIMTRVVRGTPGLTLITAQTAGALLCGLVLSPFDWVAPSWRDGLLLSLVGIVALLAHACVNQSLLVAKASVVAPYQYTLILWAALLGFAVFGDIPGIPIVTGAAIIVITGLVVMTEDAKRAVE